MVVNDDLELLHLLNASEVKEEIPDESFQQHQKQPPDSAASSAPDDVEEPPMPTGIADMGMEIEAADEEAVKEAQRINDIILQTGPPQKKRRIAMGRLTERAGSEKRDETLKAPLTTFGHSSRPRRSVNYASIERGEEAQSQSLVTEFHTGKKRQKKTRDELDENYVEGTDVDIPGQRKRRAPPGNGGRAFTSSTPGPSGSFYIPTTSTLATARSLIIEKTPLDEYLEVVPWPTDARPVQQSFSNNLEKHPGVRRASGGFRKYVGWLSDEQVVQLMTLVQERFKIGGPATVIRTIRHVYNSMPHSYRRDWERKARLDVFESRIFVPDMVMPLSEIRLTDPRKISQDVIGTNGVRANCCSIRPIFYDMTNTIAHYLKHHDLVHLFGCDFCLKAFSSRGDLTKHDCKDFAEYMYQLTLRQETLTLEAAYMYLCCSQCGLWLSVKASPPGAKGWAYFATAIKSHSCQPLVPVIAFFINPLKNEGKGFRMSFQMMSTLDIGFPMSCSECEMSENFKSVAEAEEHFKTKHDKNYQCKKCSMTFGTEFMYMHHIQTHVVASTQLAHYLLYTATFRPPPNSGRAPHVGFNTDIPAIGGLVAAEIQAYETLEKKTREYVKPFENTLRKKVLRWKKVKKTNKSNGIEQEPGDSSTEDEFQRRLIEQNEEESSSSLSSDSGMDSVTTNRRKKVKKEIKIRGDLGYEHIDREEMFAKPEEEKEARRMIEKMLNKSVFNASDRLLEPQEALDVLKESHKVTLPPLQSSLADDIAAKTMRQITIPLWNCIDPLKDAILVNKIYVYCPKCESVTYNDAKGHAQECGVEEDTIIEVYHAASGPHAGVRCIEPTCETHLCSVPALRTHLNDVHKKTVKIPAISDEKTEKAEEEAAAANDDTPPPRYDRSMMALARVFCHMQIDSRSDLARMTDLECQLPLGGLLEAKPHKIKYKVQQTPAGAPDFLRVPPHLQQGRHVPILSNHTRMKPFKLPRSGNWYDCNMCGQKVHQLEFFVEHLISHHMQLCAACGSVYNSHTMKRVHVCKRTFPDARRIGTVLSGCCSTCGELGTIDHVARHMLSHHFSSIEYIKETGEVMPKIKDVRVRTVPQAQNPYRIASNSIPIEYPRNNVPVVGGGAAATSNLSRHLLIIPVKTTVPLIGKKLNSLFMKEAPPNSFEYFPPDPSTVNPRLMCFMCEMSFDSPFELATHLEEHPEKWARCPFCEKSVADHFDLQQHLLSQHVVKISGTTCCAFCHENHRYMCSHLLYRCPKISKCSICGQKSPSEAMNRTHMLRNHSQSIRRFQCAYCPKMCTSVGEFYEHHCQVASSRVYWCTCSPWLYFESVEKFYDHYDTMHVQKGFCTACKFKSRGLDDLVAHRGSHMKSGLPNELKLALYILCRLLVPKQKNRDGQHHSMGEPNAVGASPRTLFDALEGPNAISKLPNGATQRNVTLQMRPGATSSNSNDLIVLSDEELNTATSSAATRKHIPQVDREVSVRVEDTQDGYKAANKHPGYVVEESDELDLEGSQPTVVEPVVKAVHDENGDDELAVVAEVEHTSGTLPSTIALTTGREKKHKCTKCSSSFITEKSLKNHITMDHKMDAGDTICAETYGIPVGLRQGWLCRNCSVVFEDQPKHHRHMTIHGDTTHTCNYCCGISFNQSALANHKRGHMEGKIFFGCGTCQIKFPTDMHLMEHLSSKKHQQKLFYFCKVCAYGSSLPDVMFNHILIHAGHPYTIAERFGAVPVQLLNFNPTNEQEFKVKVFKKEVQIHVPSDCSHRSMLAQTDTLVSCKTCHCYQPFLNFMACNKFTEENGFPPFPTMDVRMEPFPLAGHFSAHTAECMIRFGSTKGMLPMNPQQQLQQHNRFPNMPPPQYSMDPRRMQQQQHQQPSPAAQLMMNGAAGARVPAATHMLSMTPNGPRVSVPVNTTLNGTRRSPPHIPQTRVANGKRYVVANGHSLVPITAQPMPTPRNLPSAVPQQPGQPRNHVAVTTKCQYKDCNKIIFSDFDRDLHKMHDAPNTWFCRQCGHSEKSEKALFMHYVKEHLTPAHMKHESVHFKSCLIQLRCPFPTCHHYLVQYAFQAPKVFEKHMRSAHANELPFEAPCCDARFVSKALCDQHERAHEQHQGIETACCSICGSLNMWASAKDERTGCLQSHTIRHGLDYRSSCRQCLRQFPADVNQAEAIQHMRDDHGRLLESGIVCQMCGEMGMDDEAFTLHCRQKHIFHILVKSTHSQKGELVVSTGEEYQNFAGLTISRDIKTARMAAAAGSTSNIQPSTSAAALLPPINRQVPTQKPPLPSAPPSSSAGGNAALVTLAAAIHRPSPSAPQAQAPQPARRAPEPEVYTIDSD